MKLHVALAQLDFSSRKPDENVKWALDKAKEAAQKGAHIFCLPELFPYGPLQNLHTAQDAAKETEEILTLLQRASETNDITICAGLPHMTANKRVLNSMFIIRPQGKMFRYDKLHLFPPFNEHEIFSPGKLPVMAQLSLGGGDEVGVGPMICYDIRFPELSRNYSWQGCSLLVVSALWPLSRRDNFVTLLRARAMENQCFVVAANGCGISGSVEFAGSSLVAAPDGSIVCRAGDEESLSMAEINLEQIRSVRSFFNSSKPQGSWNYLTEEKICTLPKLKELVKMRKAAGHKLVFTNGCFDILHAGHVSYLKDARSFGDFLVVGLNSDSSVKRIKGASRPVNPQDERALVLSALSFVDFVVIFDEDTPEKLIHELEPDVLVKGADWAEDQIVGADFVKAKGGRVERIVFEKDTSTTAIIEKIKQAGS